jgi:hypothetical protein
MKVELNVKVESRTQISRSHYTVKNGLNLAEKQYNKVIVELNNSKLNATEKLLYKGCEFARVTLKFGVA